MRMTRKTALGLVLGLSIGILADSSLFLLLHILIIFISPVLLIPPAAGMVLGNKLAGADMLPEWKWPGIILAGSASLILAVLTPYAVSVGELRWYGNNIPALPNSSIIEILTEPFGSSMAGPSVTHVFEPNADEKGVIPFYHKELTENGWKKVNDLENGAWFTRSGRHMFIRLAREQGRILVRVTYSLDSLLGPQLVLLLTLVLMFYVYFKYRRRKSRDHE